MADDNDGSPDGGNVDPNTARELARARADLKALREELKAQRGDLDSERNTSAGLRGQITKLQNESKESADRFGSERAELTSANEKAIADLRSEIERTSVSAELRVAAVQAGVHNVDDILRLADTGGIKRKDDGTLDGVAETVAALKESRPYLFADAPKPGVVAGTTTNGTRPPAPAAPTAFDARTAPREDLARNAAALGITNLPI